MEQVTQREAVPVARLTTSMRRPDLSRVDVATELRYAFNLCPFTSLPSALLVGSCVEPGARWGSLLAGAAISLAVSGTSIRPSG